MPKINHLSSTQSTNPSQGEGRQGAQGNRSRTSAWAAVLGIAVFGSGFTLGQDAVRPSMAGAAASASRMQPTVTEEPYNLKLGPINFRLGAAVGAEYNDNINLSSGSERADDFLLVSSVSLNGDWQVTPVNVLRIGLNVGYSKYLNHPQFDTFSMTIGPDSLIAYDIYIGGIVKLTLQDRFGISHDPTEHASLSNVVTFRQFTNTATASALFDLNKILLTIAYDHDTAKSLDSTFNYTDHNADSIRVSTAYLLQPSTTVGLDTSATYNYFAQNFQNNSTALSAGPFIEHTLSKYITLRASGGVQDIMFDRGGLNMDSSDFLGWYGGIEIAHRLNHNWTETLSLGHETSLGLQSNYETTSYVRYSATVRIFNHITAGLNAFYEQAKESASIVGQNIDRYGGGITFGYIVNRHLSINTGYQYINKTSNVPGTDYAQNRIFMGAGYQF